MSYYAWPVEYHYSGMQWTLRFPDWPDITVVSVDWSDAIRKAAHRLCVEIDKRIDTKSNVPSQSELGPNHIPVFQDAATSARLERYLKEQKMESLREASELLHSTQLRRAAFLADYRAAA